MRLDVRCVHSNDSGSHHDMTEAMLVWGALANRQDFFKQGGGVCVCVWGGGAWKRRCFSNI